MLSTLLPQNFLLFKFVGLHWAGSISLGLLMLLFHHRQTVGWTIKKDRTAPVYKHVYIPTWIAIVWLSVCMGGVCESGRPWVRWCFPQKLLHRRQHVLVPLSMRTSMITSPMHQGVWEIGLCYIHAPYSGFCSSALWLWSIGIFFPFPFPFNFLFIFSARIQKKGTPGI